MLRVLLVLSFFWQVSTALALTSYLTPERVLIVANEKSEISLRIARLYQKLRKIPETNLLLLPLPRREEISRPIYLKFLEKPVANFLQNTGLVDQILAIVLMPEVPHKIRGKVAKEGDAASVDSELTLLYRKMLYGPYRLGGWLPNPFFRVPSETPFEHDRFDIYLVTRIAGYREKDCENLIKRGLLAEKTGPPYTLVLDAKNGPQGPGDNWLYATYLLLKDLPGLTFSLSFDPAFLLSAERVIGYASWGSNDPNYPRDRRLFFKFLPGAIGVTFVSTSARTFKEPPPGWEVGAPWQAKHKHFGGSPQSLIADLIRLGITGISGNAYEPYLSASARPYLLFPAYLRGKPLAEAYYRSLAYLSWQTVVVGDPLAHLPGTNFRFCKPQPWFEKRKKRFLTAKAREDHLFLAEIYLRLGLKGDLLREIKKLREKEGKLPTKAYALLLSLLGDPKFEGRLKAFLKEDQSPAARFILAILAKKEKKYGESLEILEPLLKDQTQALYAEALALAGEVELAHGDCQRAIKHLEKAISLLPGRWELFPALYKALKRCGHKERAARIKKKIFSLPGLTELWPRFKD